VSWDPELERLMAEATSNPRAAQEFMQRARDVVRREVVAPARAYRRAHPATAESLIRERVQLGPAASSYITVGTSAAASARGLANALVLMVLDLEDQVSARTAELAACEGQLAAAREQLARMDAELIDAQGRLQTAEQRLEES
jgi:hypothetical protein